MKEEEKRHSSDTNELFEAQLKEILDSGPEKQVRPESTIPRNSVFLDSRIVKKGKFPVDSIIRIIAAIAVIILLVGFGMRIALS